MSVALIPLEEEIKHYDSLNETPALILAIAGDLELRDNLFIDNCVLISSDDSAFVAFRNGEAVGVLTYRYYPSHRVIWLMLSYVRPEWRRCGVYSSLWKALVEKAKLIGVIRIRSSTAIQNSVMRVVAAKLNRREIAVTLDFEVKT